MQKSGEIQRKVIGLGVCWLSLRTVTENCYEEENYGAGAKVQSLDTVPP